MTKVATRPEIYILVVIGECHLEIEKEVCMHKTMDKIIDRIIKEDCKTMTEITLGEEIIGRHKITEVSRITEVDVGTIIETMIEMTIEMTILEEVEVSLGKDEIHILSEGMTEVVVNQNQDQGLVQESVQR